MPSVNRLCRSAPAVLFVGALCLHAGTIRGQEPAPTADATPDATPESTQGEGPTISVEECLEAHAASQQLRQSSSLLESRQELLRCSDSNCPDVVRADCLRWTDDLQHQIPSVVFRVTADGEACADVAVYLNGEQLFTQLPTKALELNPGEHTFKFVWEDQPPVQRVVVISEGEKYAPVVVAFQTPGKAEPSPVVPGAAPADRVLAAPTLETRPIRWPTYVLAGVGAVGVAGFVGFGLSTNSLEGDLRDSCSPGCTDEQVDRLNRRAMMADISLGVGLAALAAAGTLYFTRPTKTSTAQAGISLHRGGVQGSIRWPWD